MHLTMPSQEKFSLVRSVLRTLGLSADAVDDIVDRINDFLSDKDEKSHGALEYPYHVRDDFLSPAEQSFFLVLKTAISGSFLICPKVGLGDLFYARSSDPSKFRTYTNKIDRKHVDFLLCDPKTVRPLLGIELDDKSHQRDDRRNRDEFVQGVFGAARLPLLRIPARQSYLVAEITSAVTRCIGMTQADPLMQLIDNIEAQGEPLCPKCGGHMVLRTAKSGPNQGGKFWGCSSYPKCNGIVKYEAQPTQ